MSNNYACVEDCPKWKTFWVMVDLNNGHPGGRTYFWVFPTKKTALQKRKIQHKEKLNARLSYPIKIKA